MKDGRENRQIESQKLIESNQGNMSQQEVKQYIRQWVRANTVLVSDIGNIELGKQIGEGGTALVFESKFAGKTAVKFLIESVFSPPSTRYKRFLGEYVNLVKLVPTGVVVPIYHFGIQDMGAVHIPYVVMERCDRTLHEQYHDTKLQDVDEFEQLLERLLIILETVHNAGIVHRDIKPKNILLRPNGDWVLADFGISWFDPQLYVKLAETRRSDRLANWGFSAPEQFRRDAYDKATPCLDLYALGQTLYYCVSGQWIAGSNYPCFAEIAPSLKDYDSFIERLVRQRPKERFQSVSEIREFLKERKPSPFVSRDIERAKKKIMQTSEFDRRLRRAMPGSSGYVQAKGRDEINRVLVSLSEACEEYGLWWSRGRSDSPAIPMKQLSEEIWLIWFYECDIIDLWIYRHPTPDRQYVIIHLAPRPTFGVVDIDTSSVKIEEAGYFQGRYITRAEYDDEYATIDGDVVEVTEAELRCRNLQEDFFILAPQLSVCLCQGEKVHEVYLSLCEAGKIVPSLLEPLEYLERPFWMHIYD